MTHSNAHMYKAVKAKWSNATCGAWPSVANFENAEKIFSAGNNNAISCAMQLRETGMLSSEYAHTGLKPAFNDVRTATAAGYLRAPAKPIAARVNSDGRKLKVHKVLFVKGKVTAKGKAKGAAKGAAKGVTTGKVTTKATPASVATASAS